MAITGTIAMRGTPVGIMATATSIGITTLGSNTALNDKGEAEASPFRIRLVAEIRP